MPGDLSKPRWQEMLKGWKLVGLGALVLTLVGSAVWFVGHDGKGRSRKVRSSNNFLGGSSSLIHVALCSDDPDLRAAAVAIKSAHMNSADPSRMVFHFITTPELAPVFRELFRVYLEDIVIEVHSDQRLQDHIQSTISFRKSSRARKVLASPFNFAPFYIHEYIKLSPSVTARQVPAKIIYIDTDTVIMGDLAELHETDMQGHPCAAVKYCLQTMDNYINFDVIRDLGYTDYDPKACIANRGLLLIDVPRWTSLQITEKIENWMKNYANSKQDLWLGGMSQPPWLLAMNGDYLELGDEWNCNSLGRDSMGPAEARAIREHGFDHQGLRKLGVSFDNYGNIRPYVVTCSEKGKLLHYNGAVKPWLYEKHFYDTKLPACAMPESMVEDASVSFRWKTTVRIFCKPVTFVNCVDIWSAYISNEAACALRDYDQEWTSEEKTWEANRIDDDRLAETERKQKAEQMQEKKEKDAAEQKARENSKSKLEQLEQHAKEAQAREEEADKQRALLESRDSPD
eukprot:TRINITY_DN64135_c0_g1_i1.p1 TRINITY_DN64135_c0_g1~~TRINITY_DN64135_c0_g1_i1.p1  ORF type:complete len:513 (+),score=104.44 TRINITY_DN64135_c0_g1_i1:33-1571(+)